VVTGDNHASAVALVDGVLKGNGTVGAVTATAGMIDLDTTATASTIGSDVSLDTGTLTLSPGVTVRTSIGAFGLYDRLAVTGAVSLAGAALSLRVPFTLPTLATYTILDNDGSDPVNGTFADLPEGGVLVSGATTRCSAKAMSVRD
jgi:hypothetical protein